MSTRASVVISGDTGTYHVYHHSDGYPEYLGVILNTLCNTLQKKHRYYNSVEFANAMIKHGLTITEELDNGCTFLSHDEDFKLSRGIHDDADYVYYISCVYDGCVYKYHCNMERRINEMIYIPASSQGELKLLEVEFKS